MKKIIVLYPGVKDIPIGGLKVIYDYINKLANEDYSISIIYSAYFKDINNSFLYITKCFIKYLYLYFIRAHKGCSWYKLYKSINEKFVWKYTSKNIPKGDIYIATAVTTAKYIDKIPINPNYKFYFIQDYETFIINNEEYIKTTYKYNLTKITISNWLKNIIEKESNQKCYLVPNGFDSYKYHLTIPIQEKSKFHISMLYHKRKAKDIPTGLKALEIVKKEIPQLKVTMFGVYNKPSNLPEWISYIKDPSESKHLEINNNAAIYLGCSKYEGWGLTIGEAMMCGQAVVCTDNAGYKEMAENNVNALISPICDPQALAANIIKLINDDDLRIRIAQKGLETIQQFNINNSYQKFKSIIQQNAFINNNNKL